MKNEQLIKELEELTKEYGTCFLCGRELHPPLLPPSCPKSSTCRPRTGTIPEFLHLIRDCLTALRKAEELADGLRDLLEGDTFPTSTSLEKLLMEYHGGQEGYLYIGKDHS